MIMRVSVVGVLFKNWGNIFLSKTFDFEQHRMCSGVLVQTVQTYNIGYGKFLPTYVESGEICKNAQKRPDRGC